MIAGTIAGTNNPDLDAERFIQEEGWVKNSTPGRSYIVAGDGDTHLL